MEKLKNTKLLLSCEQISLGHPDKIADLISERVLEYGKYQITKKNYKNYRAAIETLICNDTCIIAGESNAKFDTFLLKNIVIEVLTSLGYTNESYGSDINKINVINRIKEQSVEINKKVKDGAGDQGNMWGLSMQGYKNNLAMDILNEIKKFHWQKMQDGYFWPDAKFQIYPLSDDTIGLVFTTSKDTKKNISNSYINYIFRKEIFTITRKYFDKNMKVKFFFNFFEKGGPQSDTGLTGRKLICDAYGSYCPHGGGAFYGKDASKVDKTGKILAKYIADDINKHFNFPENTIIAIQLTWNIGENEVANFKVLKDGINANNEIYEYVKNNYQLQLTETLKQLDIHYISYYDEAFKELK